MSGMHAIAKSCAEAETRLGHDAFVLNCQEPAGWEGAADADIHVAHTHFPEEFRARCKPTAKVVFIAHGTPEHLIENETTANENPGYGPAQGWMMTRDRLARADAFVTFWKRHQWFYQTCVPRERIIDYVPMGVDLAFWKEGIDHGRYAGTPSVWTSENPHRMKWPLDLFMLWPLVREAIPLARLHAHYIPWPMHRTLIDLAGTNGSAYVSYLSAATYPHDQLRNIWKSLDFYASLVRYGDHNCTSMQARAAGVPVISYVGNEYADYWIPEGDQRAMAAALIAIFRKEVEPRVRTPVPDLLDMGRAMVAIYERLLDAPRATVGSAGIAPGDSQLRIVA